MDNENELNIDRRWLRDKLKEAELPSVEIISMDKGVPSKECMSYELARTCEYVINGCLITGNRQALGFIYTMLREAIMQFGLIPDEKMAERIDKFISDVMPNIKETKDKVDLTDLEF